MLHQDKEMSNVTLLFFQQFEEQSPYRACVLMMDFDLYDLTALRIMSTKLVYHNILNLKVMEFISKFLKPESKPKEKKKPKESPK